MRFSTRCRYGLRATLQLAREYGKGVVKRSEIAEEEGLSDSYLENILITLKQKGFIKTQRGAKGGYLLSRSPEEINVYQIISALEGDLAPTTCIGDNEGCNKAAQCAARDIWLGLYEKQKEYLSNISLKDALQNKAEAGHYSI